PVWFDIDGTLLHTRVGHDAFRLALRDIYGWEESMESVVFAGNTDLQVLMDLSRIHAGDPGAGLDQRHAFFARMAEYMEQGLCDQKPDPVPGAAELVRHLVGEPGVVLGLITGNARDCAYIKLRHVDLDLHFSGGGFGDEHPDRNQLALRAQAHLRTRHLELSRGWVIGDTPRDIRAALHIGARGLGVASGSYSEAELKEAGAAHVVSDLLPTAELLSLLLTG
ncbi:MAG: HAD family hydrolase, partial [Kiritimatiellia bacterium]